MDGLSNHQRAQIWMRRWNRTFVGKAIVNADFTFRSVNTQFCKIVGLTAGELIGRSFVDMTPEPIRSLDVANARLIMEGKQEHYAMPKIYQPFPGAKKVYVALQVEGVCKPDGEFDCFEIEVIELSEKEYLRMVEEDIKQHSPSDLSMLFRPRGNFLASLPKYWKIAGVIVGMSAWVLWEITKLAAQEGKDFWQVLSRFF